MRQKLTIINYSIINVKCGLFYFAIKKYTINSDCSIVCDVNGRY